MATAAELLGPGGPLAGALAGYEVRDGQLEMARAVSDTLEHDRILLCEAGTGTGKTLAYLVPAILSGKKVVVSTATRALQEQIFFKDLPLVSRALGVEPSAALMKGLSNYVCRRRYQEFTRSVEGARPRHARSLGILESWVGETESGDVSELAAIAEDDPIWGNVVSSSDTRVGSACAHHAECFVTQMKREAEAARLIVVNHHLFFADLALRGPHPGRVIPDYDAVIFDEAHLLEDIATDFFGTRVSRARIEQFLRDSERSLLLAGALDTLTRGGDRGAAGGERLLAAVGASAEAFWLEIEAGTEPREGRLTLERDVWSGTIMAAWYALDAALDALGAYAENLRSRASDPRSPALTAGTNEALEVITRRSAQLRDQLASIAEGAKGHVTWMEKSGRTLALSASPVDVSGIFRQRVFETIGSVVMTSATLASPAQKTQTDGHFSYVRGRLGLDATFAVRELEVASPFDYPRRALLYTPADLPAPSEPEFVARAADRAVELIDVTGGGCFFLATSFRVMNAIHRLLAGRLGGRRLFVQGAAPKAALLSAFRAAGDAVLVATQSFWQGVDVPGRALRLVILEKVPFAVPSDPVLAARAAVLEADGKNPFTELSVPAAAISLKQGFGRLIRSRADAGIVALFDGRVLSRGYGKRLLAALPPVGRTEDLEQVRAFWRALA
jgi:ATP-dependent DNA helicase DinG